MIATPFLRAAAEQFEVTLLAKPHAAELQPRFWPDVKVEIFNAPWTAFRKKYHLWRWPWRELFRRQRRLAAEKFDWGLSARWDPRDHWLLKCSGARERIGFPRLGSRIFLTRPLLKPPPQCHRYEYWRAAGRALGLELPPREQIPLPPRPPGRKRVLVHSGAGQPARVWPLENFHTLVGRLRETGLTVQVICDPPQIEWWRAHGESAVECPRRLADLMAWLDAADVFIGNDSGPGHLAAFCGVPTFTFFGPQRSEWFAPLHPQAQWLDDQSCPYKPCKDYCRFPSPRCMENIAVAEAWPRVKQFLEKTGCHP